jgi:hypothetical protein
LGLQTHYGCGEEDKMPDMMIIEPGSFGSTPSQSPERSNPTPPKQKCCNDVVKEIEMGKVCIMHGRN